MSPAPGIVSGHVTSDAGDHVVTPRPPGLSWHITPRAQFCRPQVIKNSDILNPVYPSTLTTQHNHPTSVQVDWKTDSLSLIHYVTSMIYNCVIPRSNQINIDPYLQLPKCRSLQHSALRVWQMKLFVLILSAEKCRSWQIRRYESVAMSLCPPSISFSHSFAQHKYLCNCILENVLWEFWGNLSMGSEERCQTKSHHLVCIQTLSDCLLGSMNFKIGER